MTGSKCMRHFKALTRKNLILYIRSPLCSIVEILIPIVLMALLTWFRIKVPLQKTDLESLQKYKHPSFPVLRYQRNSWKWDPEWATAYQTDFMAYNNYAPTFPPTRPGTESMQASEFEFGTGTEDAPFVRDSSIIKEPTEVNRKINYNLDFDEALD